MLSIEHKTFLFQFHFHQVKGSQSIFLWIMALSLILDLPVQMLLRQLPQPEILWPVHPPGLVRVWEDSGRVNNLATDSVNIRKLDIFHKFGEFPEIGRFYMKDVCVTCLCSRWRPLRSLSMPCPRRTSPDATMLRRLFCTSFKVVATLSNFSGVIPLYMMWVADKGIRASLFHEMWPRIIANLKWPSAGF